MSWAALSPSSTSELEEAAAAKSLTVASCGAGPRRSLSTRASRFGRTRRIARPTRAGTSTVVAHVVVARFFPRRTAHGPGEQRHGSPVHRLQGRSPAAPPGLDDSRRDAGTRTRSREGREWSVLETPLGAAASRADTSTQSGTGIQSISTRVSRPAESPYERTQPPSRLRKSPGARIAECDDLAIESGYLDSKAIAFVIRISEETPQCVLALARCHDVRLDTLTDTGLKFIHKASDALYERLPEPQVVEIIGWWILNIESDAATEKFALPTGTYQLVEPVEARICLGAHEQYRRVVGETRQRCVQPRSDHAMSTLVAEEEVLCSSEPLGGVSHSGLPVRDHHYVSTSGGANELDDFTWNIDQDDLIATLDYRIAPKGQGEAAREIRRDSSGVELLESAKVTSPNRTPMPQVSSQTLVKHHGLRRYSQPTGDVRRFAYAHRDRQWNEVLGWRPILRSVFEPPVQHQPESFLAFRRHFG